MRSLHERKRFRQKLYSKVVLLFLVAFIILLGLSVKDVFQKERDTNAKRAEREGELVDLQDREGSLQLEIDRLNTDRGLEEELRSKFEVGREGEGVIVIVDPGDSDDGGQETRTTSFWGRIKGLFDLRN